MPFSSKELKAEYQSQINKGWRSRSDAAKEGKYTFVAIPVPVWEEAKRAHRAGHTTLTSFLMKDPLPGRSALDRMSHV